MSDKPVGLVEIFVNGQKVHTLEMADIGSIHAIFDWSRFPVHGTSLPPRDFMRLHAHHPMKDGQLSIPPIDLTTGDEITLRIVRANP